MPTRTYKGSASGKIRCPKCGDLSMSRQPREGFWQETVFSFFGFYPWECTHCRVEKLMHNRGVRVRIKKPIKDQAQSQS